MVNLIEFESLSFEEKGLALLFTGFLNKKNIDTIIDASNYKNYVNDTLNHISLFDLIDEYHNLIEGIIVYDLAKGSVDINLATNLMLIGNYLAIPRAIKTKLDKYNYKVIYDTSSFKGSNAKRQNDVFELVKDHIKKDALIHQVTRVDNFLLCLRDQAIKDNLLCIYTSQSDEDIIFRHKVLEYLDKNIPIYGWNDDEIAFIADISKYGDYMIPADWSCNHSYFTKFNGPLKQRYSNSHVKADPNKHYICIEVSDGDNIQWMETNFMTASTMSERMASSQNYKLTFSFPPLLNKCCYDCAKKIYDLDKNNYFVTGASGIGYMNPSRYPKQYLDKFVSRSQEEMAKSDIRVVTILDNLFETCQENLIDSLSYYAKCDQIDGALLELDPNRYESGNGLAFFINNKPFVSVRFSLWGQADANNRALIDEYINKINNMKPNINSVEGYSLINFHPWSIHITDLDYLVSKLKPHIEIVYANEFLELMKNNVKR